MQCPDVSIVIPTYGREQVLVDTVESLLALEYPASEIILVDQTARHEPSTAKRLEGWERAGRIRWIRQREPSIPRAMNAGFRQARGEVVLFLDDDIVPAPGLVLIHARAHASGETRIVAGQVLQPGEEPQAAENAGRPFSFNSSSRQWIREFMGGNFSVRRDLAIELGGFDENFVHVAYCFEAEFSHRTAQAGERILFEPGASIRHLKAARGGTRSFGHHLTTARPSHAVGAYYHLLRSRGLEHRYVRIAARPLRAVRTRHHLRRPWWILPTLAAEFLGFLWALALVARGPRYLRATEAGTSGA